MQTNILTSESGPFRVNLESESYPLVTLEDLFLHIYTCGVSISVNNSVKAANTPRISTSTRIYYVYK